MLNTEKRNPMSTHIDKMTTEEMVRLTVTANYDAVKAAEDASTAIADAVDAVADAFLHGHRLFYIGAGTSGRLGIIDATECPPTYGVSPELVNGIIAGGKECVFRSSENREDSAEAGIEDIRENGVAGGDVVIGISAAGNADYVKAALEFSKSLGCVTVALTSNEGTAITKVADIVIVTDTGAEVITGSTRMKAGTAQKIVLNAISTCAMVKTGKVYENMMINLVPSNIKLTRRVINIVREILGCDEETAKARLEANEWNIRRAVDDESE